MPAYSKTTWVNGQAPAINATNLNKIEQGIADALPKDGSVALSGQLVTTAGSAATPAIAPTGDANTGIFFPAADTIAFGEGGLEAMRINSSSQIGIGTTSPTALVSMHGAPQATSGAILTLRDTTATGSNSTYGAITFISSPGTDFSIGKASENANSALAFRNANTGAEFMRITSTGNVGIGTTSPSVKLDVTAGTTANTVTSFFTQGNADGGFKLGFANGSGSTANSEQGALVFNYTTTRIGSIGFHRGGAANCAAITFSTSTDNERMRIDSAGNVGIGTTSPTFDLHVYSAASSADIMVETNTTGGDAKIALKCNGTGGRSWYWQTGDNASTLNGRFRLVDSTAGAERLTIDSTGNVGIGDSNPSYKLSILGTSASTASTVRIQGQFISTLLLGQNADGGVIRGQGGNDVLSFWTGGNDSTAASGSGSERMRITSAGYLLIGYTSSNGAYPLQVNGQIFATSSTIATSDGRYKKDVVALDGALDIVKALNPVQFSWKDHPVHKFNTDVPTVGFIAQEVEQALANKSYLTSIIKKSECTWETETGEFVEREVTRDVEKQVTREVEREITETIDGEEVTRTVTEEIIETITEQVTEIVQEPVKETHTEEFLGIAESNLIAILTKAVKELAQEVEALKAQLNGN